MTLISYFFRFTWMISDERGWFLIFCEVEVG
jgi:hypothetical protein